MPSMGANAYNYGNSTEGANRTADPRYSSSRPYRSPINDYQVASSQPAPTTQSAAPGAYPDGSVATPSPGAPLVSLPDYVYNLNGVNPNTDLIFNSYMRGADFDKSTARAQSEYIRQQLQSQLTSQIPAMQQQLREDLVDIGESAAARGAARSSSRLNDQNTAQRREAAQEAALRQGIADKQAQALFEEQYTIGSIDRQTAEQSLEARQRLLEEQNRQIAYQRALQELGLA